MASGGFLEKLQAQAEVRQEIKTTARARFKQDMLGNIGLVILPSLVAIAGSFLLAGVVGGFAKAANYVTLLIVFGIFLLGLFLLGVFVSYGSYVMQYQSLVQMRDENAGAHPIESVFGTYLKGRWFKTMFKAYFFVVLFTFLWGLIPWALQLLGNFVQSYAMMVMLSGGSMSGMIAWMYLFKIAAFVTYLIVVYKSIGYYFAPVVAYDALVAGEKLGGRAMLKRSLGLVKGNRWELIAAGLSFVGWVFLLVVAMVLALWLSNTIVYIVVGLLLAVATLYLAPYVTLTFMGYYDELKSRQA